jgi:hypothetical protein
VITRSKEEFQMASDIKFSVTNRISSVRGRKSVAPFSLPIRRNTMISKLKLGMLAVVAMMGIATPAFAQGLNTGTAANTYGWNSPQADAIPGGASGLHAFAGAPRAHVRSGLHAFARVPRAHVRPGWRAFDMVPGAAFGSDNPSATGGGSVGYNSYEGRDS